MRFNACIIDVPFPYPPEVGQAPPRQTRDQNGSENPEVTGRPIARQPLYVFSFTYREQRPAPHMHPPWCYIISSDYGNEQQDDTCLGGGDAQVRARPARDHHCAPALDHALESPCHAALSKRLGRASRKD